MSAYAPIAWMDLGEEWALGAGCPAATYTRAAARCAAEQQRVRQCGGRPAQVRVLGVMADLFRTLAEARRGRDEAERRLAEGPLETLDDILAGYPARPAAVLPSANPGAA